MHSQRPGRPETLSCNVDDGAVDPARRHCLRTLASALAAATTLPAGAGALFDTAGQQSSSVDYRPIYEFDWPSALGVWPDSLMRASDGAFYGTCGTSGALDSGTIFRYDPNGAMETIFSFGEDFRLGQYPTGRLVEESPGVLLGTAMRGGINGNNGTVFRVHVASRSAELLYSFRDADGIVPQAGLIADADGAFYGHTREGGRYGGGTLYRIESNGLFEALAHFRFRGPSVARVSSGLMQAADGGIYGSSYAGGAQDLGTLFRLDPGGAVEVVHSFAGADGAEPMCRLVQRGDGTLFGTASKGGSGDLGVIFRFDPATRGLRVLHHFARNTPIGGRPGGAQVIGSDGFLYGMTSSAYANGVFRIHPNGSRYAEVQPLGRTTYAADLLESEPGVLLGVTTQGGTFGEGSLYRISRSANV